MLLMVDHHVHFRVIARYDGARHFAGRDWLDTGWPGFPALAEQQHGGEPGLLAQIRQELGSACAE
ncbi:MAG: hypothetical protein JNK99_08170 [Candidatus Accumulibacter sp.]|uniref:hypothetical protein n=1 Tax=Accumulibacter sp. TaxID=2053492 RepID=UPI001A499664|nr:hypothetical protein [Accumulibacter sp.]MBL8394709.1 hypothetical protein [Accumulibacter sp.]